MQKETYVIAELTKLNYGDVSPNYGCFCCETDWKKTPENFLAVMV